MANSNKNSNGESRSIDSFHHPEPGKRWTLLFIGNHGRTITLKRFKGMVILTVLVLCISIAITGALMYLSFGIRSEKNRLESDLKDLKAEIKALRYEKDVLMTKLVLAEARSKPKPVKKTPEPIEPEIPRQNAAESVEPVQPGPVARIEEKPPVKKAPPPLPVKPPADSALSVEVENFKIFSKVDENLLRVQFKIKNTSPGSRRVSGHAIVVLKGEELQQNQWLPMPRISLSNGKPTGRQRGYSFGINHFKEMRFKTNLPKSPEIYRDATVYVFTKKGDLLLEKDFPVNLPPLPARAASKPPSSTSRPQTSTGSSRSLTGAPPASSAGSPPSATESSPATSTARPPSTDELMNTLKNPTSE